MGENIGKAIMTLIIIALICLAVSVVLGTTLIFNSTNTIESKTKRVGGGNYQFEVLWRITTWKS